MAQIKLVRPTQILVGAREYKVIVDPLLQLTEGLVGMCDQQKYEIRILPRFLSSQLDEVLWHEIGHAVNTVYLNGKLCEDEVSACGSGLSQVMKGLGISFEWEKSAIVKESNDKLPKKK